MGYDFYASRHVELAGLRDDLETAFAELQIAKAIPNRDERKRAVRQADDRTAAAARRVALEEPHAEYLWYKARGSELDTYIRHAWQDDPPLTPIPESFRFAPDLAEIAQLPQLSLMLRIPFRLRAPYISRDERDFHVLDNPLRREKILQTPMIPGASWKGCLRSAMVQQLAERWCGLPVEDRERCDRRKEYVASRIQMARLFGTELGVELTDDADPVYLDKLAGSHAAACYRRYLRRFVSPTGFFAGRLHLYSTFFNVRSSTEIINPHSRATGVGVQRGPILIECVPGGTRGDLILLYVPFGRTGRSEGNTRLEVAGDLIAVARGLQGMLTTYGFGAKTSSGFGICDDDLVGRGTLAVHAHLGGLPSPTSAALEAEPPSPTLPRYLQSPTRLHQDLCRPDGTLKSEAEYEQLVRNGHRQYGKAEKQLYGKAKKWWEGQGRKTAEDSLPKAPAEPVDAPPVKMLEFESLTALCELAATVANALQIGGGK